MACKPGAQWNGCVKSYPSWPKLAQHLAKHVKTTQIICVQCGDANEPGKLFRREQVRRFAIDPGPPDPMHGSMSARRAPFSHD